MEMSDIKDYKVDFANGEIGIITTSSKKSANQEAKRMAQVENTSIVNISKIANWQNFLNEQMHKCT